MLPAATAFAATVRKKFGYVCYFHLTAHERRCRATKPGALRFPPTVIVDGEPPEKIPPPANKSKPALTLPGCTTPPGSQFRGPEPGRNTSAGSDRSPSSGNSMGRNISASGNVAPGGQGAGTTCGTKMSPAAVTLESAKVRCRHRRRYFHQHDVAD